MQNFIQKHLYNRTLLSYLLLPLGILNALIQLIRRVIYENINFLRYNPEVKIISVGNIVSGGSGKTPTTIWIARKLGKQGYKVAVSHRGYKGAFEKQQQIISDRKRVLQFASKAGDEPFLLANKLPGIPVVVGRNRTAAIKLLLFHFTDLDYIILDDSFQHLKVEHDFDVLVFNTIGGIGNGFILPAGILREPISAVKKADYLVINGEEDIPSLEKFSIPRLQAKYEIDMLVSQFGKEVPISKLKNSKVALLSAIGQPVTFEKTIKKRGIDFCCHVTLPDHYDYKKNWVKIKTELIGYDYVLTTEKDFAKLQFIQHNLPLVIVQTKFHISGELTFPIKKA